MTRSTHPLDTDELRRMIERMNVLERRISELQDTLVQIRVQYASSLSAASGKRPVAAQRLTSQYMASTGIPPETATSATLAEQAAGTSTPV